MATLALTDDRATGWQVQSRLRTLVGSLPTGSQLPSERVLAEHWGVARMTLRKGIEVLVEEGRLESRHGSGTFVARQPIVRTLGLTSFSADMTARGLRASTRTVDFEIVPADEELATTLGVAVGDELVTFTRVRFADDVPIAVETSWLPSAIVPGLSRADIEESLYESLKSRYALTARRASSVISAAPSSQEEAGFLDMVPGEPCLRITMTDRDADGQPFMLAVCSYHAERYQLQAELIHELRPGGVW